MMGVSECSLLCMIRKTTQQDRGAGVDECETASLHDLSAVLHALNQNWNSFHTKRQARRFHSSACSSLIIPREPASLHSTKAQHLGAASSRQALPSGLRSALPALHIASTAAGVRHSHKRYVVHPLIDRQCCARASAKSKSSVFCVMRSLLLDLGRTQKPC